MFNVVNDGTAFSFEFSSRLDLVDRLILNLNEFITDSQETGNPEYLRVVLRELLCNAVEHGNGNDVAKLVRGSVTQIGDHRYRCTISDEGIGIDPSNLSYDSTPDPVKGRSMGYSIINSLADEIRFNGAETTVFITLPTETAFLVEDRSDCRTIRTTGDISAAVAEKFRDVLIGWFDSSIHSCIIDMGQVTSIDSISLGIIVSFRRMLDKNGDARDVQFVNVSSPIMNVFRLTQIHSMYTVNS